MLKKYSLLVLALSIMIGINGSVRAQHVPVPRGGGGGGWQFLGSAHVDGNGDHDKINCHGKDTFRRLKIRVSGSPVQFDRINVVYGNHNSEPIPFRFRVGPGGDRTMDLRGGNRDIAYVEFWYQKASWASKPQISLYGQP